MKSTRKLVLATLVALFVAAPASAQAVTVIGSGSVAMEPYIVQFAAKYKKLTGTTVVFTPNGGNAGVKDVQAGRSQFAGNARGPLPSDSGTVYYKAFADGMCIIVNPQNKLTKIGLGSLADIYTGKVTNWGQVSGSSLTSTIAPIGRETSNGQYTFFQQAVLKGENQAPSINTTNSDGLVANGVGKDPNAIGYLGAANVNKKSNRILNINGYNCDKKYVKSQKYILSRFLYLITPINANPEAAKFIDWIRKSVEAGVIIDKTGGVPLFNKKAKKKKKKKARSAQTAAATATQWNLPL